MFPIIAFLFEIPTNTLFFGNANAETAPPPGPLLLFGNTANDVVEDVKAVVASSVIIPYANSSMACHANNGGGGASIL